MFRVKSQGFGVTAESNLDEVPFGSFDLWWHDEDGRRPDHRRINIHPGKKMNNLDLMALRAALRNAGVDCTDNDRLFYVDNEDDEIPIDSDCELQEALKFAMAHKQQQQKSTMLIIAAQTKTVNGSAVETVEPTVMTASKIVTSNEVPISEFPLPIISENKEAMNWFKDYMESYKQQIVTEVTEAVFAKFLGTSIDDPKSSPNKLNKTSLLWQVPNDKSKIIKSSERIRENNKREGKYTKSADNGNFSETEFLSLSELFEKIRKTPRENKPRKTILPKKNLKEK